MEWINSVTTAIDFIEDNLTQELTPEIIAKGANVSSFYFQKGFAMLCGYTVSEYVRLRRLALAGIELVSTDNKIIDIAVKYGFDSPDSFTKAFTRFHKATPSAVRKGTSTIKYFAPLKISFNLKGGSIMEYKIIEKKEFTVIGSKATFNYSNAYQAIPEFWKNHYKSGKGNTICGMYGINIDKTKENKEFDYLIADDYDGKSQVPDGFVLERIPAFTWACFPCVGPMPVAFQATFKKVFSEWLPNCKEYDLGEGYCVEMYSDPSEFSKGTLDENYYSEIWIPVVKN